MILLFGHVRSGKSIIAGIRYLPVFIVFPPLLLLFSSRKNQTKKLPSQIRDESLTSAVPLLFTSTVRCTHRIQELIPISCSLITVSLRLHLLDISTKRTPGRVQNLSSTRFHLPRALCKKCKISTDPLHRVTTFLT